MASLDIDKVFNRLEAHAVEMAFLEHDAPAWAIAAVFGQRVDHTARLSASGSQHVEPHSQRYRPPTCVRMRERGAVAMVLGARSIAHCGTPTTPSPLPRII